MIMEPVLFLSGKINAVVVRVVIHSYIFVPSGTVSGTFPQRWIYLEYF